MDWQRVRHGTRLILVTLFGLIPALLLSIFAAMGLLIGGKLLFGSEPITGFVFVAAGVLGLFGTYAILAAAWGAEEQWQRIGLAAGIIAASVFIFFDFSVAGTAARPHEPSVWPLAPIAVAVYLLLEYYLRGRDEDESSAIPPYSGRG